MKYLILFAFCLAAVSASPYLGEVYPRTLIVDPIEEDGRIANGQTASTGQFPYQVGLALKMNVIQSFWCGGSLISNEWILTAAHCTDGVQAITAYLGATVRTQPEVTRVIDMKNVIIHPGWSASTTKNDISLIKITPVSYSSRIQKVQLPAISSSYSTYVGQTAISSGWGLMSDSATSVANNLQYGQMKVVNNRECANVYGFSSITSSMLCVATPNAVSPCQGDSGGPLVLTSGNRVQIGLVSFGAALGCEQGLPVVFTRVTSYLDWIKTHTKVSY